MRVVLLAFVIFSLEGFALRHRLQPWEAVEVPLTRTVNGWYVAEVEVSGASKRLVVDTGSPWLWAFGSQGDGEDDDPHFHVQYTGVQLEGVVLHEAIGLPGSAVSNVTVQQCSVGRATSGDNFWLHQAGVDGVAGLACGTGDAGSSSTSSGLDISAKCLARAAAGNNVFSVELNQDGGTLSFSAIPERLLFNLKEMPATSFCGNWRAPMQVFSGEGVSAKALGVRAEAIIDSGEPGIRGPLQTIMQLAQALGADAKIDTTGGSAVQFVVPCDKRLGSLSVAIGNDDAVRVTVQGEELLRKDSEGGCHVLLRGSDAKQWVLGMPFFRSIRGVVFSGDEQKVYIAS